MTDLDSTDTIERLDDAAVLRFLSEQPQFFDRHPAAIAALNLPHAPGGAVSLVERQMTTLREGNRRMRAQVDDMIASARHNQTLSEGVHALARALLACDSVESMAAATEKSLLQTANADRVVMVLAESASDASGDASCLRRIAPEDPQWRPFATQLDEQLIRCGLATDAQLAFLFGDTESIGSTAIAPLYANKRLGVLALASADPTVFTRDKGHLFLQQVAELVSAGIAGRLDTSGQA